jgi:hypothetical protein
MNRTIRRTVAAALLAGVALSTGAAFASENIPPFPYSCKIDYADPVVQHDIPGVPPIPPIPQDIRCYG